MKHITIILALINFVVYTDACIPRPAAVSHKPLLIDPHTPVYFVSTDLQNMIFEKKTDILKKSEYATFHCNPLDINPYTLYLKVLVITDYYMYEDYDEQNVVNRVLSYMSMMESFSSKFEYPKLKFVVTGIIIPTKFLVMDFLNPPGYSTEHFELHSKSNIMLKMQQWLFFYKNIIGDIDFDFSFILSSWMLKSYDLYIYSSSYGYFNCHSNKSSLTSPPVIIARNEITNDNIVHPYLEFLHYIDGQRKNWLCPDSYIRTGFDTNQYLTSHPECTPKNLKKSFNTSWPSCLKEKPKFMR
ncbi:uncharacterized protein LOC103570306 [Microplitis demolitor]|uniref:uncharacterized protein LOC103570306 n=1 Tax=Microplitis demolitor TaxID=69319 RepID=UPI000440034D|nr:uncharacterized protein LOC103570306 [Microplitis demolitor]